MPTTDLSKPIAISFGGRDCSTRAISSDHVSRDVERVRSRPPILKRATAGLILVAIAALAIHAVIGLVVTVFWIAVVVAAIAAVAWALNTIL